MNKELRKVLDLDGSSSDASSEEEPPDHPPIPPTPTPGSAPMFHPAATMAGGMNGFSSPEKSLLASLSRPQTRDGRARPGHGGSRGSGSGGAGVGGRLGAAGGGTKPQESAPATSSLMARHSGPLGAKPKAKTEPKSDVPAQSTTEEKR